MMRRVWIILLLLWLPLAQAVAATPGVRAFLDRSHVSLGDTVTLNIQSQGALGTPDLTPLQGDFQVLGTSRSDSLSMVDGKTTRTQQIGIALKPLHAGTLVIPALAVGGTHTQPLTLQVGAAASGGSGKVGDAAFMETSVSSSAPYVDAQAVYTVRLYYLPGVDGSLGEPTAPNARLIPLDRDQRYTVDRNGYTYDVLERSWALIPQQVGALTVAGPVFRGQRLGPANLGTWFNNPNALLNGQFPSLGATVSVTAPATHLDVRAIPANAGQPWLPARALQLKLTGVPANGDVHAGAPLTLTLVVSASGQPASALPEPELPPIAGARVYPDQTQDSTDDGGEWLRGTRTRSFALVPDRNGDLTLPAITLDWWNLATGKPAQATLPAHILHVTGVTAPPPAVAPPVALASGVASAPTAATLAPAAPPGHASKLWRDLALASVALWLVAVAAVLAWWWHRRARRTQPAAAVPAAAAQSNARRLRQRALDAARACDAAACERALLAWARATHPEFANLGAVRDALAAAGQRDALDGLLRARWQGADVAPASAAIAREFARGFAWQRAAAQPSVHTEDLPPLYPQR